jgi:excisionase family DNA binding protein
MPIRKTKYHVEHVRRVIWEGSTEGVKIGRTWLVKRTALDGFMKRTATKAKHDHRRNKTNAPDISPYPA